MKKKCIMLIDDNVHDNYFSEKVIKQDDPDCIIIKKESAEDALHYIASEETPKPDIIFLDIYMPIMDGWDFLDKYCELNEAIRSKTMILMLATSGDPAHIEKANTWDCISDYITKPLTKERLQDISDIYLKHQMAV